MPGNGPAARRGNQMAFSIDYDQERDVVICRFTGVFGLQEADTYAMMMSTALAEHDCKRILLDGRDGRVGLSTVDLYDLPSRLESHGVDRTWKRALVVDKQTDEFRFYEDVSNNRGFRVKVFQDPDEALKWLTEED